MVHFLQLCYWIFERRYIYIYIYIYTLSRSKERKWFHIKKTRSRQYLTETMTDADDVHDLELLANAST